MFKLVEGLGSELGLVNTFGLIFVVLAIVAILAKLGMLRLPGKNSKTRTMVRYNPHPPGEAVPCRENRDMIIEVKTKIEGIEGDIKEIKMDIKELNKRRT